MDDPADNEKWMPDGVLTTSEASGFLNRIAGAICERVSELNKAVRELSRRPGCILWMKID